MGAGRFGPPSLFDGAIFLGPSLGLASGRSPRSVGDAVLLGAGVRKKTMEWAPSPVVLSDIVRLLKQADSPDTQVQRQLAEAIGKLAALVDAPCYYCYILTDCRQEPIEVRQRAGLLLKARLASLVLAPGEPSKAEGEARVLAYVKSNVMRAILDPNRELRATAGTILTALVAQQGVEGVPNLMPFLFELLDNPNAEIADGALSAFSKIIEDEIDRNIALPPTGQPQAPPFYRFCSERLLPKLFQLATDTTQAVASSVERRAKALTCLNHFERGHLFAPGDVFEPFFNSYWDTLGHLAMDSSPETRKLVLSGMVHVVVLTPDVVLAALESLMPFVLGCLDPQQPYEVRLEGLELLSGILKCKQSHQLVSTLLQRLLPTLVQNTRYSTWDYMQMDQSQLVDGNAATPDTAEDLAPVFHTAGGAGRGGAPQDEEEEEEEEEPEASVQGTWGSGWTVRKAAAMLLDHLSTVFDDAALPHLLPVIESRLQSEEWEIKESAVLTLGAIARGCIEGLNPFLPRILGILLPMCDNDRPILRSISLWTLSRFSLWISPQPEILNVTCRTLLGHILDSNKRVQEAACSAFACLEEDAGELLVPFLPLILDAFSQALQTFQVWLVESCDDDDTQTKNMLVLLDAIGTLAGSLGTRTDVPDFYVKIVTPLVKRWTTVDKADPTIVVMFECLSCVVRAIRQGLPNYSTVIVDRCLFFIRDTLHRLEQPSAAEEVQNLRTDRERVECSFDLLSSLCEATPGTMEPLLQSTDLMDLLRRYCELSSLIVGSPVKQACFALIGDLAEHAPRLVSPHVPSLVPAITPYISSPPASVSHNATWVIGQIALHVAGQRGELQPYAEKICSQLVVVMLALYAYESLIRNSCITMGRVALACPEQVAVEMNAVFGLWCRTMTKAPNDAEKTVAIKGLCHVINQKQDLAVQHMPALLEMIASLYMDESLDAIGGKPGGGLISVPQDLHGVLMNVLAWLRTTHAAQWNASWIQLQPSTQTLLNTLAAAAAPPSS